MSTQSQYKSYNVDAHKVEAHDSLITGNNNIIFGNNNRIAGDKNKVYGNNNAIVGNNNVVKGENNIAKGNGNEVYDPFGNAYPQATAPSSTYSPSNPFASQTSFNPSPHFFAPPYADRALSPVANSSYVRPVPTRERSSTYPVLSPHGYEPPPAFQPALVTPVSPSPVSYPGNSNAYFQPVQQLVAPESNPYLQPEPDTPFQPPLYSTTNSNPYLQSAQQEAMPVFTPQPVTAYIVVASPPSPSPYVNPFSPPQEKKEKENKDKDLIQEGTLVFIVNETDAEYVREFCNLVSTNSGQRLGCHISAGRMCLVGLGDLNKIRDTIIQNLPLLNMKLKEWSWNTFGKNVCADRDVYYKRLFKEYTREDVDCWRNKPTKIAA